MAERKYNRRTPEQWQAHIDQQVQSGLSIKQYCKEHGLAASNYYHWRKKLLSYDSNLGGHKQDHAMQAPWLSLTPQATEFSSSPANDNATCITLQLPGGIELSIHTR